MKLKYYLLFCSLVLTLFACKKKIVYEASWIGSWEIYQVDSAYTDPGISDSIWVTEEIITSGFVHFNDDSTGLFEISTRFSCDRPSFKWSYYNGSQDSIVIEYGPNLIELVIATEMTPLDLVFYKGACNPSPTIGSAALYRFHTRRSQ